MSFDALLGHLDFTDEPELPDFVAAPNPQAPLRELGRPTWLYAGPMPLDVRDRLLAEATARRGKAARVNTHSMVEGGPIAAEVQTSAELLDFVRTHVPEGVGFAPTTSYYHWYANGDDRVEPHRDTAEFFLGCILLLEHVAPRECRFYLHPPGGEPLEVPLEQGHCVVFFSGAVTHSRSRPAPGESVNTLTWGFRLTPCE